LDLLGTKKKLKKERGVQEAQLIIIPANVAAVIPSAAATMLSNVRFFSAASSISRACGRSPQTFSPLTGPHARPLPPLPEPFLPLPLTGKGLLPLPADIELELELDIFCQLPVTSARFSQIRAPASHSCLLEFAFSNAYFNMW